MIDNGEDDAKVRSGKERSGEPLWAEARRDRATARLLEDAISFPPLSRVLLLNREELFPTFRVPLDEGFSFTLSSPGFVYLTHSFRETQVSLTKLWRKMWGYTPQIGRIERAADLTQNVADSTRNAFRDRLALGVLNTIAGDDKLRQLINGPYPIEYPALRQAVGDYSRINFQPLLAAWRGLIDQVFKGRQSKSALSQLGINIDVLKDATFSQALHVQLTQLNVAHYQKLVCGQGINERTWRQVLLDLHKNCFLDHVGPLYAWCVRCPETGVLATIASSNVLGRFHCPRCRRVAHAETYFFPAGWLEAALNLRDGMLGACVGWQLKKRGLEFKANVPIAGTELDFVLGLGCERILIECKMPLTLKADETLTPNLSEAQNQLHEHVALARQQGMIFARAACVLNLSRQRLASIVRRSHPTPRPKYQKPETGLISYEDLADWLDNASK